MANNKMTREELIAAAKKATYIMLNTHVAVGEQGFYACRISRKQFDSMMQRMQYSEFHADVIGNAVYIGKD